MMYLFLCKHHKNHGKALSEKGMKDNEASLHYAFQMVYYQ